MNALVLLCDLPCTLPCKMEVGRLRRNTNEVQLFEQHSRLAPDLRLLEHRFLIYVSVSDHLAEKKYAVC